MSDKDRATGDTGSQKFSQMSFFGKLKHVGKLIIFFFTFGFAFPNIMSD